MRKSFLLSILAAIIFCFSCKKSDVIEKPTTPPVVKKPMITGVGTTIGSPVTKSIGAAGGTVTSTDGRIKIEIPAGALAAATTISIQPISNEMKSGFGNAYRLSPHNTTFLKPVTLTFTYKEDEISNTIPELLGIGYQKDNGQWKNAGAVVVDKTTKKISVTTTHFSDWGFFAVSLLHPVSARLKPSEELDLAVLTVLEEIEYTIPDIDLTEPYLIAADRVKSWSYSGEGSLVGNGPQAHYKAPSRVPASNPEAVTVNLNLSRPGTFMMISNITILSDFRIEYLQVDESEQSAPGFTYPSRLHIYGNFGNDPGAGKRSVKISPTPASSADLNIVFWTPKLIVCDLQTQGPFSSGKVIVSDGTISDSKILNEWIVDLMYTKVESPGGSLTRKAKLVLVMRGDADGFIGAGQTSLFSYTDLSIRSRGLIDMPLGTYTSQVSGDGCGSYTVRWDKIGPDYVVERKKNNQSDGLTGRVVHTPSGFKMKLWFESPDIIKSTRTFVPCRGSTQVNTVYEPIELNGYWEEEIELKFMNRASGSSILAGSAPRRDRSGVAPGLFFDAVSLNPDLYYTTLTWAMSAPKYQ